MLRNTGNVALTDINIASTFGTNWECAQDVLEPGQETVCKATHIVTLGDLLNSTIDNAITVTADNITGVAAIASETISVTVPPQTGAEAVADFTQWESAPLFPDEAVTGTWEFGTIETTVSGGLTFQPETGAGGADDLEAFVTEISAGGRPSQFDIDGGSVTAWSPEVRVPPLTALRVRFGWFFAHSAASGPGDRLTVSLLVIDDETANAQSSADLNLIPLFEVVGEEVATGGQWQFFTSADIPDLDGQRVRLFVEAVDDVTNSLTEAGIDSVSLLIVDPPAAGGNRVGG